MAALAAPSWRRCVRERRLRGRVSSFEFLVSSWDPSRGPRIEYVAGSSTVLRTGSGLGVWVSAPGCSEAGSTIATVRGWVPDFSGTTVVGAGTTATSLPCGRGSGTWVRPRPPTTGESPSPQPSPVEGEGAWEPGSGRTRGSAPTTVLRTGPTTGESPSPQPSPVEGEGVRGRGGMGAGKRADTWVRPYDGAQDRPYDG